MRSVLLVALSALASCSSGEDPAPIAPPPAAVATDTPDPAREQARVALQLIAKGHAGQAEPVARALVAAKPSDPRATFILALALHKQKRYADAVPLFQAASDLASQVQGGAQDAFPERAHVAHFLGWARYYTGDLDGARGAFTAHVAVVPDASDSWYGLGIVELDEDRLDAAREALAQALAVLPMAERPDEARSRDRGKILARQGDLALREDRLADAAALYQRALRAWPDHYEVWAKAARCYDRLGDSAAADRARLEELNARERVGRMTDLPPGEQP